MRLAERVPEAEHARTLAPAGDDLLAIRALKIEVSEDAEFVGMPPYRLDRVLVDRLTERARRMNHRAVHAGRRHLRERIFDRIRRDLAVVRAHFSVLPDVNLRI